MGMSGVELLIQLDPSFEPYFNLFSPASKDVNRLMQTKEENDKLDKAIHAFLKFVYIFLQS